MCCEELKNNSRYSSFLHSCKLQYIHIIYGKLCTIYAYTCVTECVLYVVCSCVVATCAVSVVYMGG